MKKALVGAALLTIGWVSPAAATPIIASATGLASPVDTIDFTEVVLPDGTALTNQYAAFGVTFSGLFYNPQPITFGPMVTPGAGNFPPITNPSSIFFTTPVTGAAVAALTNDPDTTAFTALLNGVVVESFSAPTGPINANVFFGFANSHFNELRFNVTGASNHALALDNLQIGTAVPEPATLSLLGLGLGLAGLAARRRRARK